MNTGECGRTTSGTDGGGITITRERFESSFISVADFILQAMYNGLWEADKRAGKGSYALLDPKSKEYRTIYYGEWQDDMKHGNGIYYYESVLLRITKGGVKFACSATK